MDIMIIGFVMILVPTGVLAFVVIGSLFRLMSKATIEVYRDRNIINLLTMLIAWSFVIGIVLVLIGMI